MFLLQASQQEFSETLAPHPDPSRNTKFRLEPDSPVQDPMLFALTYKHCAPAWESIPGIYSKPPER